MSNPRILLIDDDARLYELLERYLGTNGFEVSHASDGAQGLERLAQTSFEVALIDIMMPGMDGLEVLRRVRTRSNIPVIMLTAKGDDTDRIVGLELGADDYVPKPFIPRELLARIRAVLRRMETTSIADLIEIGELGIDAASRHVTLRGEPIVLTGIEFDILLALAKRAGRVISREELLAHAGRDDVVVSDRTVDVHISHLRQKLDDDPRNPALIKTVRGVGYVLSRSRP